MWLLWEHLCLAMPAVYRTGPWWTAEQNRIGAVTQRTRIQWKFGVRTKTMHCIALQRAFTVYKHMRVFPAPAYFCTCRLAPHYLSNAPPVDSVHFNFLSSIPKAKFFSVTEIFEYHIPDAKQKRSLFQCVHYCREFTALHTYVWGLSIDH